MWSDAEISENDHGEAKWPQLVIETEGGFGKKSKQDAPRQSAICCFHTEKMTSRQIQMTSLTSMMKEGTQHLRGVEEALMRNIEACKQLAEVVRTSMGPNGSTAYVDLQ